MSITATITFIAVLSFAVFVWLKQKNKKKRSELGLHSIPAQELHDLIGSARDVLLFDVRQPLDLPVYS